MIVRSATETTRDMSCCGWDYPARSATCYSALSASTGLIKEARRAGR